MYFKQVQSLDTDMSCCCCCCCIYTYIAMKNCPLDCVALV